MSASRDRAEVPRPRYVARSLTFYRDLLVGVREKVATLKKQGRSLDEIIAAKPTADTDAKWGGGGFRSPQRFIGLVFQGV